MTAPVPHTFAGDRLIGALLNVGTWMACVLIAGGWLIHAAAPPAAVPLLHGSAPMLMGAGVALFILLPVLRVAVMLVLFLRERDYVYVAIAAGVLLIIATSVAVAR